MDKRGKEYFSDYGYKADSRTNRPEYRYIDGWIEPGSKVLDLGCGDGSLGELLISGKHCVVYGIDVDKKAVASAKKKGVKAAVGDIDEGLGFKDKSFDYVVLNVVLQMVYSPGNVLKEALRVGKRVIVSFPNFAHAYARLEMLFGGKMPSTPLFNYKWYNTRHIHLFSVNDFKDYLNELDAKILKMQPLWMDSRTENPLSNLFPNLFSGTCIFMIKK